MLTSSASSGWPQRGACAALHAEAPRGLLAARRYGRPVKILVLGGTSFVGRAIVEEALRRGDELTLFSRGRTGTELFREPSGDLWWRDALPPGAGPDRETSLPAGYASGLTMRTPVASCLTRRLWARIQARSS